MAMKNSIRKFSEIFIPSSKNSKQRTRLVQKDGRLSVRMKNAPEKRKKEIRNFFITLLDYKWRFIIGVCVVGFLLSWTVFGCLYYMISYLRGDLTRYALSNATYVPCIEHLDSLLASLYFSMETQHTIGYGYRYVTTECPESIVLLAIQSMVGTILQAFLTSIVLGKLLRPKKRRQEVIFSGHAVITQEDGQMYLIFRVADLSDNHLIETHVRLCMCKPHVTQEGDVQPLKLFDMNVGFDSGSDRIMLMWPFSVKHPIDEESPLFGMTEEQLARGQFEVIATMEGIIESTGMSAQARTSYLADEIEWGRRFTRMTYPGKDGNQTIYYNKFNTTENDNQPLRFTLSPPTDDSGESLITESLSAESITNDSKLKIWASNLGTYKSESGIFEDDTSIFSVKF